MSSKNEISNAYSKLKSQCNKDWGSKETGNAILDIVQLSLSFLESQSKMVDLISRVPNKNYISYSFNGIIARPANKSFFMRDHSNIPTLWDSWQNNSVSNEVKAQLLYTMALAPCLVMELFDRQNKKGPATYFECLIGHIFSKTLKVNPRKQVCLPVHGKNVRMTMDFLFEYGGSSQLHLPVKMSTRERVVQAWAHQRLLDSAFGTSSFKGIMVLFSETKLDAKSLEVVEICVPDQWLAYQSLLSKMNRIYYFDIPERYQILTNSFPEVIQIKHFYEFFNEINQVV
jgi:hypothetical protein